MTAKGRPSDDPGPAIGRVTAMGRTCGEVWFRAGRYRFRPRLTGSGWTDDKGIPPALLDNASFHKEDRVRMWMYVCHRTVFPEKELSKESRKIDVIMVILKDAQLLKTVTGIGPYYPKLVNEFVMNLSYLSDR